MGNLYGFQDFQFYLTCACSPRPYLSSNSRLEEIMLLSTFPNMLRMASAPRLRPGLDSLRLDAGKIKLNDFISYEDG